MKKTLAFILVCALLVSAFTLTAFADKIVGGADGVTDIPVNETSGSVNVKVDKVIHKYAADLTYTDAVYALPTMTWNVNTLMYEVTGENLNADTTITITLSKAFLDLNIKHFNLGLFVAHFHFCIIF